MLSGLIHILSRINYWLGNLKWWLKKTGTLREQCHGFCPNCPYSELCIADEIGLVEPNADGSYDKDDFDWYADADYDYPME